jgi:hypothetical protein
MEGYRLDSALRKAAKMKSFPAKATSAGFDSGSLIFFARFPSQAIGPFFSS